MQSYPIQMNNQYPNHNIMKNSYHNNNNNNPHIAQINNRYSDSDTIYIDSSFHQINKQNDTINEDTAQMNTSLRQKQPLQPKNLPQQKQATTFQRNYIIYQPMTAFQQPEISYEKEQNIQSFNDEESQEQPYQKYNTDSFINDTESRDMKKIKLQQFVKGSYIWKEDSTALQNILSEKMEELKSFYLKQEEKVNQFFNTLERMIMSEKNNMIYTLSESLKMNLNQVDSMMKQLLIFQDECDKLQEDVAQNFTDIIEEMRNEPFNDILKMYNQKLQDFDQFTKKQCQSVHVELVQMDFVGANTTTNLTNKWETQFKNTFINKVVQLNSQYTNIMKDNLTKILSKNSSRDKVSNIPSQLHSTSFQNTLNQNTSNHNNQSNFNLSSNGNHLQSNSSLSINSKRSNRSTSLIQQSNNQINNCNKSSLSHVQTFLQTNNLDFISPANNSGNIISSQRSNDIHQQRYPQQAIKSQRVNSILNTSDIIGNNSFTKTSNQPINLNKTTSLADKIRTQTLRNTQVSQQPEKRKQQNSVYTNILKNGQKGVNLQIDVNKQMKSSNKQMFTTTSATSKFIDFQRNNENINTINFNFS